MSDVTREGVQGARPGREALVGVHVPGARRGGGRRRGGGEQPMVPEPTFTSYYGLPVLNPPVWAPLDIAGYLFLGGLAGASSLLGEGAEWTGRPQLARAAHVTAAGAISLSAAALVHDLGRPSRFVNMLRVFKPTSPMSVGSWLLAGYGPAAAAAAIGDVTGRLRPLARIASSASAALGPAVAAYTAVLIADTSVPAWHGLYRELPFLFVGSGGAAAGGMAMLLTPVVQAGPARRLAVVAGSLEMAVAARIEAHDGLVADAYHEGRAKLLMRSSLALSVAGVGLGATLARRHRWAAALAGACLLGSSAASRFGVFAAGMASAKDPKYTVQPQRERLERGERARRVAR